MNGNRALLATALFGLCFMHGTRADPLHAIRGGAYWHHDSGWIFPEKIGSFVRVGMPQDIAGSRDAVAYYAYELNGSRTTASVDVYPVDSATAATTFAGAKAAVEHESPGVRLRAKLRSRSMRNVSWQAPERPTWPSTASTVPSTSSCISSMPARGSSRSASHRPNRTPCRPSKPSCTPSAGRLSAARTGCRPETSVVSR
jgi:hypothetical protein